MSGFYLWKSVVVYRLDVRQTSGFIWCIFGNQLLCIIIRRCTDKPQTSLGASLGINYSGRTGIFLTGGISCCVYVRRHTNLRLLSLGISLAKTLDKPQASLGVSLRISCVQVRR